MSSPRLIQRFSAYNVYGSVSDTYGINTVLNYKRTDTTLYLKSTLSGGTAPKYTSMTLQMYKEDGTTLLDTQVWTFTYNSFNKISSKVANAPMVCGIDISAILIDHGITNIDATTVPLVDVGGNFTATNLEGAMTELFTNVNNGKNSIYSAIVGKGKTPASYSYADLSAGVASIGTGLTAVAANILSGKTVYIGNAIVTGTLAIRGDEEYAGWRRADVSIASSNTRVHLRVPNGAYLGTANGGLQGIFADDANFISSNMLAGKTYFGLAGGIVDYSNKENTGYIGVKSIKADGGGNLVVEPYTGYYREGVNVNGFGSIIKSDSNFVAANLLATKTYFGLTGSIPVRGNVGGNGGAAHWWSPTEVSAAATRIYLRPTPNNTTYTAYTGDCWISAVDANFVAENMLSGKTYFGLAGGIKVHSTAQNRITPSLYYDNISTPGVLYVKPEAGWYDGIDSYTQVTNPNPKVTTDAATPSGGVDGDYWIQP
jgi:hypothetical protein